MSKVTYNPHKISYAVNSILESLGEPAAHDLAKYIKAECGFDIDKVATIEQLQCLERTLRQIFGSAADLLLALLHQKLEEK